MDNSTTHTKRSSSLRELFKRNRQTASTVLAVLLACIVLLPLLGHKPLTNWDEGIYAEISREMLSLGPLVPHWNYQPWFEKPPLMLWITVAFFKVFGVTEFWARAGSALSGVGIVALLHAWLARRDIFAAWLSIRDSDSLLALPLETHLPPVRCALLVLQGEHDEYATVLQTDALRPLAPQMQLVRLAATGHTPHREQPEIVLDRIAGFLHQLQHDPSDVP